MKKRELPAGWSENVCELCGAHIGFGLPGLHLSRCDDCSDKKDDEVEQLTSDRAEKKG